MDKHIYTTNIAMYLHIKSTIQKIMHLYLKYSHSGFYETECQVALACLELTMYLRMILM